MINNLQPEFSFCSWYKQFMRCSLVATIIQIPDEILKYLEYDMFLLPLEAIKHNSSDNEWNDSSSQNDEVFCIFFYNFMFVGNDIDYFYCLLLGLRVSAVVSRI